MNLFDCSVDMERVPKNDHIDYQIECSESVSLAFAVSLLQFALFAIKHGVSEFVSIFAFIELMEPFFGIWFDHCAGESMNGLVNSTERGHSLS